MVAWYKLVALHLEKVKAVYCFDGTAIVCVVHLQNSGIPVLIYCPIHM